MTSRFTELAVDCADPRALAAFWAAALGYTVLADPEGNEFCVLRSLAPGHFPG